MQVKFTKITLRNILSVGDNPFTIELSRSPTTHVTGKNGVGKSSILAEGLTYALFGKSFRELTLDKLVNNINKKGMLVEVEFEKNGTHYTIVRGHKPKIFVFKINREPVPEESKNKDLQSTIERVLGFDFSSFIKTIVLGHANYKSFLNLTAGERRAFVDYSLNTEVFTLMSKQAALDLKEHKSKVSERKQRLAVVESVYQSKLNIIESQKQSSEGRIRELKVELAQQLELVTKLNGQVDDLKNQLKAPDLEELARASGRVADLNQQLKQISWDTSAHEKQLRFYQDNIECPTCHTEMTEVHRSRHIDDVKAKIDSNELKAKEIQEIISDEMLIVDRIQKDKSEAARVTEIVNQYVRDIQVATNSATQIGKHITNLSKEVEAISIEAEKQEIKQIYEELEVLDKEASIYTDAVELLKDTGIKTALVSKYLPIFNQYCNQYLDILEFDQRVRFDVNFNEQFIGRYVDEYDYRSFSQGERERIDLALMFAWRSVIAISTGVNTNILILDEIGGSSLDSEGVDGVFRIIDAVCTDQNVFIISHRVEAAEKCRSTIRLVKKNGFVKLG